MSDAKVKGLWWLPEHPEKQLSGEIVCGPAAGAQLSLLGHFFKDATLDTFTVWGMTVRGKPVTLFNCHTKNLTMHLPGARVAEISSYFGVMGGHFKSPDEMKFAKVFANLSHLHEWTWTSAISVAPKESGNGWQICQEMIPDISLGTLGPFSLALKFTGHLSPGFGDCRLSEDCVLCIEAKELTPYESFENVVRRFQHFVALGVSRPVYALSVSARVDKPKQVLQGQEIYEEFEVIRKLSRDDAKDETLTPHDMQFCLADLQPQPAEFLKRYFDKHQLLEPVCDLYFSTLYNREMYVQQRFLSLAHAVEAYHRAFIGGKYQTDDEYRNGLKKILWNAIPHDVDADFRASLKNKLKYLHEFSLRKRIQDICARHAAVLTPFFGDSTQFAGAIADQRNWLTHPDSTAENRPKETDWTDIWLKSEQLSLLIEVCLLQELGFSDEAIAKLLPRNRRTRAIQLNRK